MHTIQWFTAMVLWYFWTMVILKSIHVQNHGYEPLYCMHTILSMWPMVFTIFLKLHKTMAVDHGIVCIHYLASHQWFYHHFFMSISMVHSHGYWHTLDHASHWRFVRVFKVNSKMKFKKNLLKNFNGCDGGLFFGICFFLVIHYIVLVREVITAL